MEPADLNSSSGQPDEIDALLRTRPAALRDDGFSARVLAALPPPAPTRPRALWPRVVICTAGAIVGGVVAWSQVDSWDLLQTGTTQFFSGALNSASALLDPALGTIVGIGLLVTAGSLVFAFRPRALAVVGF